MRLLKIEAIGHGTPRCTSYGVWELTGLSKSNGPFVRRSITPQMDYSNTNSVGSRGVYAYYLLEDGPVYEVKAPQSWKRLEHYYVTYGQGQEWRLSIGEVFQCLANARLASMSSRQRGNA